MQHDKKSFLKHVHCFAALTDRNRHQRLSIKKSVKLRLRSNHKRCSKIKDVLKNFTKCARKYLCRSLFFNSCWPESWHFIKKETPTQALSSLFCNIFKNTFYYRTTQSLLFNWTFGQQKPVFFEYAVATTLQILHKVWQVTLKKKSFWWKEIIFGNGNNPHNIYIFKVNNRSTRKKCEICSKFAIKTPERRHCFYC